MAQGELAWSVEEACLNAWPAPREVLLEGWLLRASGGPSRRTNSVNPLRGGPQDPTAAIEPAEQLYRRLGQPALFRVPTLVPAMDPPLAERGYRTLVETCVLCDAFERLRLPDGAAVELAPRADGEWLTLWEALNAVGGAEREIYRSIMGSLVLPAAFAKVRAGGKVVAIAYGVLDRTLLVLEAVNTAAGHQRRGHASQIVGALVGWAQARGGRAACLQVIADNDGGRALYQALGFGPELYRYHYRRKDFG